MTTSWSSPAGFKTTSPEQMHVLFGVVPVDLPTRRRVHRGEYRLQPGAAGARGRSWSGPSVTTSPNIAVSSNRSSSIAGRQGRRGRAHRFVLHQLRPAGQPDHGVLIRRDEPPARSRCPAGGVGRDDLGLDRAQRSGGNFSRGRSPECTESGISLSVADPFDAVAPPGAGR